MYTKSTTVITCYSDSKPIFTKDYHPLGKLLILQNDSIIFPEVKKSDQGIYTCRGTMNESIFEATSELLVGGNYTNKL